jgi:glycerophosphoryl diester phosphodiesterase
MSYAFPFQPDALIKAEGELLSLTRQNGPFFRIGHRIGNHLEYPTNVNKRKYILGYKNTCELLDDAFSKSGLTGIELDVRLGPDGVVYVVHDKIKKELKSECWDYLKENSLEKFLRHWIEKEYYKLGKVYIELKLSPKIFHLQKQSFLPDVVNESEKKLIDTLFLTMTRIMEDYQTNQAEISQSIGFISFSLAALHYAFVVSGFRHSMYLITTTDQFMKRSLSRAMFYVPLTPAEKSRIQYSEWLSGIWFDPVYIDDPVSTFLEINKLRKNPLEFFVSTYGMKYSKLLEKFQTPLAKEFPVSGMIFDLE